MWLMKNTSSAEGKILFGEDFMSYDDMLLKHAVASLDR
jgi:hypothetical protein